MTSERFESSRTSSLALPRGRPKASAVSVVADLADKVHSGRALFGAVVDLPVQDSKILLSQAAVVLNQFV